MDPKPSYEELEAKLSQLERELDATQTQLGEKQAFLDMLVDRSPIPLLICSPNWTILRANQAFYDTLALEASQVIGKYNLMQDGNFKRPEIREKFDQVIRDRQSVSFDFFWSSKLVKHVEFKHHLDLHIEFSIYPLFDANNDVTHIVLHWLDITKRKRQEDVLRKNKDLVQRKFDALTASDINLETLKLSDIVNVDALQSLLDDFSEITGMCIGMTGNRGEILASSGWREICSEFHRAHPETRKNCEISDTTLANGVTPGSYKLYRCKNNIWEASSPIVIGEKRLGKIFLGQYFYADETIDYNTFRNQAQRYGFDEEKYLAALDKVPRFSRETVEYAIRFITKLAQIISELSLGNFKLSRALHDRKQAEKALRQSELRLKEAQTIAGLGNFEHDFQHDTVWWSDQVFKIYGIPKTDIPPSYGTFIQGLSDSDREKLNRAVDRAHKFGEGYDVTLKYQLPTGDFCYVDVKAEVIFDDQGKPKGLKGTAHDVTNRIVAEKKLIESEAQRKILIDTIPDLIWLKDPDGVYLSCNPMFESFFGAKEQSIAGKTDYDFVEEKLADFFRDNDRKAMELDGPSINEEWLTFSSDGYQGLFETIKTPMKTPDGELVGVLGIARDITERKIAEEEKQQLERQLQQAQKMESIGKLAGGIAHDFNNILYPIIGFTQLSQDELPKDHPIQENLNDVLDGAKRAVDLIKRILHFSRQREPELKPIVLQSVIKETHKLLRSTIPTNIDLLLNLYEEQDAVLCDESEIHEVLLNLCTNAYHAIAGNSGKIVIGLKKQIPPPEVNFPEDEALCLSVKDNGIGISEKIKDKIFEPYVTTKDVGKGSGLGLSIVYGIIENYGGKIHVETGPETGTCFEIFLPIADKPDNFEKEVSPDIQRQHGSEHILLVDDEFPILKLGKRALESRGYRVTGIQNSVEALNLFEANPDGFDLVITDMAMPNMVGSELAEKLLQLRPDLPIIICSGYSENLDKLKAREIEISAIVDKPIDIKKLLEITRKILDKE